MDTDTERGRPCEDGAEAGAREPQGKEAWSCRKLGDEEGAFCRAFRKNQPCGHSIFSGMGKNKWAGE